MKKLILYLAFLLSSIAAICQEDIFQVGQTPAQFRAAGNAKFQQHTDSIKASYDTLVSHNLRLLAAGDSIDSLRQSINSISPELEYYDIESSRDWGTSQNYMHAVLNPFVYGLPSPHLEVTTNNTLIESSGHEGRFSLTGGSIYIVSTDNSLPGNNYFEIAIDSGYAWVTDYVSKAGLQYKYIDDMTPTDSSLIWKKYVDDAIAASETEAGLNYFYSVTDTIDYTGNIASIDIPDGAILYSLHLRILTKFNDSGGDTLYYTVHPFYESNSDILNQSPGEFVYNIVFGDILGDMVIMGPSDFTAHYTGENGDATEGEAIVILDYIVPNGSMSPSEGVAWTPSGYSSVTAIETTITDDDTKLATSGAIVDYAVPLSTVVDGDTIYMPLRVGENAQTGTTYTAQLTDEASVITLTNASAITFTIDPNSSVAFPINCQLTIMQGGAGTVTITPGSGVTIHSFGSYLTTAGQYATATLWQQSEDVWYVIGGNLE